MTSLDLTAEGVYIVAAGAMVTIGYALSLAGWYGLAAICFASGLLLVALAYLDGLSWQVAWIKDMVLDIHCETCKREDEPDPLADNEVIETANALTEAEKKAHSKEKKKQ